MRHIRLAFYSAAHFWVDLSCALLLLGVVCPEVDPVRCILLYNFSAFAVQMPIGLLADRLNRNHQVAAAGCGLVAAAWFLTKGAEAAVLAGVGNALFHVGGGLDTMNWSGEKAGPLGVFVSPGAAGLFLGAAARGAAEALALPVCGVLVAAAVLILLWCRGRENPPAALPEGRGKWLPALLCLLLVVVLRSWNGFLFRFPWKGALEAPLTCAVVLGKTAGGLAADRFGTSRTAAITLGLSAFCFLGSDWAPIGLLGVFLFQMTMPLTLWAAGQLLPSAKGLAFGVLTFGLFLGALPTHLGWEPIMPGPEVYAATAILSLPLLCYGLCTAQKRR